MLDCSPPILALLVAAATAILALGLLGRRDRARPTCRACGADARVAVDGIVARCACGADLRACRAVRWLRRRRWKLCVAGFILAVGTTAFGWLALYVRSNALSWWVILPAPAYELALRNGWDGPLRSSYEQVLERTDDPEARQAFADAIVDSVRTEPAQLSIASAAALGRSIPHGLPARGDVLVELLSRGFRNLRVPSRGLPGELPILYLERGSFAPYVSKLLVRVDRVRIGDRDLAWKLVSNGVTKFWNPTWPEGIQIQLPSEVDLASDEVRRDIAIDATMAITRFVHFDPSIAPTIFAEYDPARWGVDVVHAPFTIRGLGTPASAGPVPGGTRGSFADFAHARWQGRLEAPRMPGVAAIPLAEALVLGLGLGLAIALATAIAGRLRVPRCSPVPPRCVACAATLVPGESLPERCNECGRPVAGPNDVVWTARGSRGRNALATALGLAVVAGIALGLERWVAAPVRSVLAAAMATPEREVRWLVRETIAMRPYTFGSHPAVRLSTGHLHSQEERLYISPELLGVAADEIVRWAAEGGTWPPSTIDTTPGSRANVLESVLVKAIRQRDESGVPSVTPEATAKALPLLLGVDDLATTPSVVRKGREIVSVPDRWQNFDSENYFPRQHMCEPKLVDTLGCASIRVRTVIRSGLSDTPLLDVASDERVFVVSADAVCVPAELVSASIARGALLNLSLEEGGSRDAVTLRKLRARGILWVGRWDVLDADGSVCGTFESTPQSAEALGLAALPDPWPETLTLRFTPATALQNGQPLRKDPDAVYWTSVVRFAFTLVVGDRRLHSTVAHYRLTDAALE
ncbi:MAG: hypothetical protein JNM94_14155 [Phycisphaerae bacterium]|nr:hypothetical protein [Phycisphaerae bacterium]